MILAEKKGGARQESGCQKYPDSAGVRAKNREAAELARREVADPALFMAMAIRQRSAPKTEVVKKKQLQHRFGFEFPVVVKPLDGRPLQKVSTQAELKRVTDSFRGVGYQVQQFLQGYTFLKVRVVAGNIESDLPVYITGAARRMVTLLVVQGVCDFTLTMATNKVTTYIIGARLN